MGTQFCKQSTRMFALFKMLQTRGQELCASACMCGEQVAVCVRRTHTLVLWKQLLWEQKHIECSTNLSTPLGVEGVSERF